MRKKILVFTVPFGGHLTILKELVRRLHRTHDMTLVITGWDNIPPDLSGLPVPATILSAGTLRDTDPALWTLPRIVRLLPRCLEIAQTCRPDLILYDFFSPEGYFAGRLLNIPYWASIPAMPGPYTDTAYLKKKLQDPRNKTAIRLLRKTYGIGIGPGDMELMSDGMHFPGIKNVFWSYPGAVPADWQRNRRPAPYVFAGNIRARRSALRRKGSNILFSLGTVVMDNLWNQQPRTRKLLTAFIRRMTELWDTPDLHVLFVTQGKKPLRAYPKNWSVVEKTDQVRQLRTTDIFVTHAGSNSFHEALVARVPMVAIPFFGDQPLVASQIERLGVGVNLVHGGDIDTGTAKRFLNASLADRLDSSVRNILKDRNSWQSHFAAIDMSAAPLRSVFTI